MDLWLKKEDDTGSLEPKKRERRGASSKIKDEDKFREFMPENSGKTQQQIAQMWEDNLTQLLG